MSTAAVELRQAASPARIGQATAVEQSRAVAEVHAMVVVAQQMPRNIDRAVREMQRSCSHIAVAEKAFYRYPRGGQQVTGVTITLAEELARCWGNIDYGIAELRRDDAAAESEMMAFAWDMETNTRPRTTFIVPHVRDGGGRLTGPREVYENNANMGARRMREQILKLMPPWFVEDAKALCHATMAADKRDGATLAERRTKAVERFGSIGVRPEQLTQKLGAPQATWSAADLAHLSVIFKSIERRETTAEEEFGTAGTRISESDLAPSKNVPPAGGQPDTVPSPAAAQPTAPGAAPVTPPGTAGGTSKPRLATTGQVGMIRKKFDELYPGEETDADRWERLGQTAKLAGIDTDARSLGSTNELTSEEAVRVRKRLDGVNTAAELEALIARIARGEVRDGE